MVAPVDLPTGDDGEPSQATPEPTQPAPEQTATASSSSSADEPWVIDSRTWFERFKETDMDWFEWVYLGCAAASIIMLIVLFVLCCTMKKGGKGSQNRRNRVQANQNDNSLIKPTEMSDLDMLSNIQSNNPRRR